MIKAVIFDLDNTLVDFMEMKRNAVRAAVLGMIDSGLPCSVEEVNGRIQTIYAEEGIEYQKVFDRLLTDLTGKIDYKILAAGIIAYRKAREAALVTYPHVYTTLFRLVRMGLKLGIVTDAPRLEAWLRLSHLNLHQIFDAVVTFEDTGVRKPDKKPFEAILNTLDVAADEAIMVGDWEDRDIAGAKALGMKTAFARYGDVFETKKSTADYELSDISQLLNIIVELNTEPS